MAGHSKFSNIKHRKGAQDKKRAKVFTRIIRQITVAAKKDPDASANPALRDAIVAAKAVNMPKEKIENAIKKSDGDAANYEEIRYEGYGIAGVAVIVETLTDNRNRSASEVRTILTKHGGSLGETGSVAFMFDRVGIIEYEANIASEDEMFEAALEAGATEVESDDYLHVIYTEQADLNNVKNALAEKFEHPNSAQLSWKPTTTTTPSEEQIRTILKMIDALEENDDVQEVVTNMEVPDEIAEKLAED